MALTAALDEIAPYRQMSASIVRGIYESDAPALPRNLGAALENFQASPFIDAAFGDGFNRYFSTIKRAEWDRFLATVTDWEQREYFSIF